MRAAVLNAIGDDKLELRDDVTTTDVGPGEVRIRMKAAGVCHSDLSVMNGTLPMLAPGIPGHEGAGEVVEVGAAVRAVEVGDHVVLAPIAPCGTCRPCLRGQAHLCAVFAVESFTNLRFKVGATPAYGFAGSGCFAEELVVPHQAAIKVDGEIPFEIAALVGCGVATGVGAVLNTAAMRPGSSVVVIGCGGVGIAAIQGARLAGATQIVAVDTVAEKLAVAKRFGATHAGTSAQLPELIQELTAGEGFDYAFEAVGIAPTIRAAYDAARRGGTVVVVGAGRADDMVQFSAQELFINEKRLLPSFYGSADARSEFDRLLGFWKAGLLDLEGLISHRLRLDDINGAIHALGSGDVIRQAILFD